MTGKEQENHEKSGKRSETIYGRKRKKRVGKRKEHKKKKEEWNNLLGGEKQEESIYKQVKGKEIGVIKRRSKEEKEEKFER